MDITPDADGSVTLSWDGQRGPELSPQEALDLAEWVSKNRETLTDAARTSARKEAFRSAAYVATRLNMEGVHVSDIQEDHGLAPAYAVRVASPEEVPTPTETRPYTTTTTEHFHTTTEGVRVFAVEHRSTP